MNNESHRQQQDDGVNASIPLRDNKVRISALFSDEDRAVRSKMKELRSKYFTTRRDDKILDGLKALLDPDLDAAADEAPLALCVTGKSQAGKSRSLKRAITRGLGFGDYGTPACPIAFTSAPAPCTLKRLGHDILVNIGLPIVAERTEHYIWSAVREQLPRIGAVALHIDEMQNATETANRVEARRIIGMLKTFMVAPKARVALIMSGTPDLADFLKADTQIRARTRFIRLHPISPSNMDDRRDVGDAIKRLTEIAGLDVDGLDGIIPRLMHAALYQYGFSIKISNFAIEAALNGKASTLTIRHFAEDYTARTGNAPSENPFLVNNWQAIDCTNVLEGWSEER